VSVLRRFRTTAKETQYLSEVVIVILFIIRKEKTTVSSKSGCVSVQREMNLAPLGKIKVVSERILINGEPFYRVQHVEAAPMNKLPSSYMSGYPHCCYVCTYNSEYLDVSWTDNGRVVNRSLMVGKVYTVRDFEMIMMYVKDAGERLSSMLRDWKKMCFKDGVNTWKGTRVDTV